jgi:hypothetical protein
LLWATFVAFWLFLVATHIECSWKKMKNNKKNKLTFC